MLLRLRAGNSYASIQLAQKKSFMFTFNKFTVICSTRIVVDSATCRAFRRLRSMVPTSMLELISNEFYVL